MRLVDDVEAAAWLEQIEGGGEDFEWDAGNRAKNRKHGVDPVDVEAMFRCPTVLAGRIVEPAHDEPRWLVLGQSAEGRRLARVFTRRGDRIRAISCRAMRDQERKVYEEAIGRS